MFLCTFHVNVCLAFKVINLQRLDLIGNVVLFQRRFHRPKGKSQLASRRRESCVKTPSKRRYVIILSLFAGCQEELVYVFVLAMQYYVNVRLVFKQINLQRFELICNCFLFEERINP